MITVALSRQDLSVGAVDCIGDFSHVDATIKFKFYLQVVFAFNFDFLDGLHEDVRLGHIDHGHCQAYIAIYQTIVAVIEALLLYRVRQDMKNIFPIDATLVIINITCAIQRNWRVKFASIGLHGEHGGFNVCGACSCKKV